MVRPRKGEVRPVEVVVLVVVIGFVAILIVPRGPISRESPRRVRCMNNQSELAKALLQYEQAHQRFSGYVNRTTTPNSDQTLTHSWVVSCLPYLGRADLDRRWRNGSPIAVPIRLLTCPGDRSIRRKQPALSYVVNCGKPGDDDGPAEGVFFNHDMDGEPPTASLTDITDGTQHTLLFSENVQAGEWADTAEADLGIVWRDKPGDCDPVNRCINAGERPHDIRYARPSSDHPGGAIVSYADGHQEFVDELIDYAVYQRMMAPHDAAAGLPPEAPPQ